MKSSEFAISSAVLALLASYSPVSANTCSASCRGASTTVSLSSFRQCHFSDPDPAFRNSTIFRSLDAKHYNLQGDCAENVHAMIRNPELRLSEFMVSGSETLLTTNFDINTCQYTCMKTEVIGWSQIDSCISKIRTTRNFPDSSRFGEVPKVALVSPTNLWVRDFANFQCFAGLVFHEYRLGSADINMDNIAGEAASRLNMATGGCGCIYEGKDGLSNAYKLPFCADQYRMECEMLGGETFEITSTTTTSVGRRDRAGIKKRWFAVVKWIGGMVGSVLGLGLSFAVPTPRPSRNCFPNDAMVQLENGKHIPMADLKIGDKILAAPGVYSEVFLFDHKITDTTNDFVQIEFDDGSSIRMTSGHYIQLEGGLAVAGIVRAGDRVASGSVVGEYRQVVSTKMDRAHGLHNPYTMDGRIVVDGVTTSAFTSDIHPTIIRGLYKPVEWIYRLTGINILGETLHGEHPWWAEVLVDILPSGPDFIPSSKPVEFTAAAPLGFMAGINKLEL
ncbi:hypothetical protein HK102_001023 [Quaeritorhiza haematococci]|nr:hypothetical protein HK102_001023 [Quaeritorhiza haematococci]